MKVQWQVKGSLRDAADCEHMEPPGSVSPETRASLLIPGYS